MTVPLLVSTEWLAGRLGDPVYASDSGFIVYAGWSPVGYGNLIVVDHGNG